MEFEPLNPRKHDRIAFDCGVDVLSRYLQKIANQDLKRNLTRVYVLAEREEIIGYYSISAHSVLRDNLPENHQLGGYDELPFLLLGRLAVDKRHQKKGYGEALVFHAFITTLDAAERIGILGMIVDAKDENAAVFYEGFGFQRLSENRNRLFLPIGVIKRLLQNIEK